MSSTAKKTVNKQKKGDTKVPKSKTPSRTIAAIKVQQEKIKKQELELERIKQEELVFIEERLRLEREEAELKKQEEEIRKQSILLRKEKQGLKLKESEEKKREQERMDMMKKYGMTNIPRSVTLRPSIKYKKPKKTIPKPHEMSDSLESPITNRAISSIHPVVEFVPISWDDEIMPNDKNDVVIGSQDELVEQNCETISDFPTGLTTAEIVNIVDNNEIVTNGYRSPICCVFGHVDSGKTTLLDTIRGTTMQTKEAGNITQQIGTTFIPISEITNESKLPGILVVDTPGHEAFINIRKKGSSISDIAIVVIDILKGLEPQTMESIKLLKLNRIPFVVAVNKCDRLVKYNPKIPINGGIFEHFNNQPDDTKTHMFRMINNIKGQFYGEDINVELANVNDDFKRVISMIPISAKNKLGIVDLLEFVVNLIETRAAATLILKDEVECTVLDVKNLKGLGIVLDCVLINGKLEVGDTIMLLDRFGQTITTKIKILKVPIGMRELQERVECTQEKIVVASKGVRIVPTCAPDVIAGYNLILIRNDGDIVEGELILNNLWESVRTNLNHEGRGVRLHCPNISSMEAVVSLLVNKNIPISNIKIGPVHKKDLMEVVAANSDSNEDMWSINPYCCILAFSVTIADELVNNSVGAKIIESDIIYSLIDKYEAYKKTFIKNAITALKNVIVYPAILQIIDEHHIFHISKPIIIGVKFKGKINIGQPINVLTENGAVLKLGNITNIKNKKGDDLLEAFNDEVSVAMMPSMGSKIYSAKIDFDWKDEFSSNIDYRSAKFIETYDNDFYKENIDIIQRILQQQ